MLRSYIILRSQQRKKSYITFKKIGIKTDFGKAYFYLYFYLLHLFCDSERDYTALISRIDN